MGRVPWIDGSEKAFDLDLDQVVKIIKKSKVQFVGLQTPEGLKRLAPEFAQKITDMTGAEVFISGEPCYGACDIDLQLCQEVDLLVHLGHAEMLEGDPLLDKVIYIEVQMAADPRPVVEEAITFLKTHRIGVATTIQHVHKLGEVLETLKEHGIEGLLGPPGGRTRFPGQVLGCNYDAARGLDVDEYLFIGTGQFHPLGMALSTGKRIIAADPLTCEVSVIDPEPMQRKRFGAISRAGEAERIAVLVSKKPGQKRWSLAKRMVELGKAHRKEMSLVYLDNVHPDILINLGVDAAVCTACPRIALDDAARFGVPVLTPPEFKVMLGERQWENYLLDEIE